MDHSLTLTEDYIDTWPVEDDLPLDLGRAAFRRSSHQPEEEATERMSYDSQQVYLSKRGQDTIKQEIYSSCETLSETFLPVGLSVTSKTRYS